MLEELALLEHMGDRGRVLGRQGARLETALCALRLDAMLPIQLVPCRVEGGLLWETCRRWGVLGYVFGRNLLGVVGQDVAWSHHIDDLALG
jgi:hypothetical protein